MKIQIWGKSKCFDTKKAERYFKERRIPYQAIDLLRYGMSRGEDLPRGYLHVRQETYLQGALQVDPLQILAGTLRGRPGFTFPGTLFAGGEYIKVFS